MGRDFYAILGLSKGADEKEIRKAYKKLAVQYHPDRNQDNKEAATKKFKEISEAYEILSDPEKKKLYDQFGEEGVNPKAGGMPGGSSGGFSQQQAQDLFARMFGGKNGGFFNFGGGNGGNVHFQTSGFDDDEEDGFGGFPGFGGFGGMPGFGNSFNKKQRGPRKPQPVAYELYFTLEELYKGLTKKVKITRKVVNNDGRSMREESEVKAFDVRPGWKSGTKITFDNAGDKPSLDAPAGDIIFVVKEKPHHLYKRDGNDLIHQVTIPLKQALCGGVLNLTDLEGNNLRVPYNEVISPGFVKTVYGKGMPISKNPSQKGNLRIVFNVTFPSNLNENQKKQLQNIL